MTGINATSGITPVGGSTGALARSGPKVPAGQNKFAEALRSYVGEVDSQQHASASAVQDLLSGKNQDISAVVAAMAKADLSFKLLVGVRNKVVEAYKQTMNMQV